MPDPTPQGAPPPPHVHAPRDGNAHKPVIVRAYPKIIFFWPTWIISLVAALLVKADSPHLGTVWMCVFAFNLLVISFDFTELVSLLMLALIAVIVFAGLYFDFLGAFGDFFQDLRAHANASFYWSMFGLFSVIYLCVLVRTRLNYWEFRHNEVIHRKGLFADLKRYSTEDLRWFKEIPDVLERLMCGSGRMILTTPRESHPIVIEHVIGIGTIDDRVADILGTKRVTLG